MNYYEIALFKSPLQPLTYQSQFDINIGVKVEISLQNRTKIIYGVIVKKVLKPTFKCKDIKQITNEYYDNFMIDTSKFISTYYVCSIGEALSLYQPFNNNIKKDSLNNKFDSKIILSNIQQKGYDFTQKNISSLLFANTGSGKTEIYIQAIQNIVNQDKQAILLMPEISLTLQMEKRLKDIFNDTIAIWHSKIQQKKRKDILDKLLKGEIKIIAGARSSLFLPYDNLGLIIVDEEHDESYKADNKPRVNVKDLSIYISKKNNIQLILGSATPSISSYKNIPHIRIKDTYFNTHKKILFDESNLSLNDIIINKIKDTLNNNKQIIVFLPTRANFKYQICGDCGASVQCPFCSVSLSLHRSIKALKCHYCNYTQAIPNNCPSCKDGIIKNYRLGTAEVQEQLSNIFKDKVIQRFDKDTATTNRKIKKILNDFNKNKIDILVGTQMLSKGHDYHNVTLAVILGIDSVLNMHSYKIKEQALSLCIQIAGRSGRNGEGEVLIQTKNKTFFNHYLNQKDYKEFLDEELSLRQDLYPPNIRLAKITFSHQNGLKAKEILDYYVSVVVSIKDIQLVGFKEASIFKIANKYRYEMIIRSHNTKKLLGFLHSIDSIYASIDMDTLH